MGGNEVLTALTAGLDARQSVRNDGGDHVVDGGLVMSAQSGQIQLARGDGLGDCLGVLAGFQHGVAQPEGRALGQSTLVHQVLHHHVGQGNVGFVHSVDAQQAANGTLHGHRSIAVDKTLGIVRYPGGVLAGLRHQIKIKIQLGFQMHSLPFCVSVKRGERTAAAAAARPQEERGGTYSWWERL